MAGQLSWTTRCRLLDLLVIQPVLIYLIILVPSIILVSFIRRRIMCGCCNRSGTRRHIRTRNAARASSHVVARWRQPSQELLELGVELGVESCLEAIQLVQRVGEFGIHVINARIGDRAKVADLSMRLG